MSSLNSLLKKVKTRKGLVITGISLTILITGIVVGVNVHNRNLEKKEQERIKREEQQRHQELVDLTFETIDQLYNLRIAEYNSIVRSIKNWNYSDNFRYSQIRKLDDLIGYDKYASEYRKNNEFYDVIDKIKREETKDKQWLYQQTISEVAGWLENM